MGGSFEGSMPRSIAAIRSRAASSASFCWPSMRTMPAVMPPMMATIGIANTRKGMKNSGSIEMIGMAWNLLRGRLRLGS